MLYKKVYMLLGKHITLRDIKTYKELSKKIEEVFNIEINKETLKRIYDEDYLE